MDRDEHASPTIVVVDPDTKRRACVVAASAPLRVIEETSLHSAFSLIEARAPFAVAISDSAAAEAGLTMFLRMLSVVGVRWLAYGQHPPRDLPPQSIWVPFTSPRHAAEVVDALKADRRGPGADARLADLRPPVPGIIVIGASTGGVAAIEKVLTGFSAECPPTLVVQHSRPGYLENTIERLERNCPPRVVKATNGSALASGTVYVAADSGFNLTLSGTRPPRCKVAIADPSFVHRPSIDALFASAAAYGPRVSAALLTGMGADGALGLAEIRKAGGHTIAQDQATSVVYGMPRVAVEMGAAAAILPLDKIANALLSPPPRSQTGRSRRAS